jgi:hypothetical protein
MDLFDNNIKDINYEDGNWTKVILYLRFLLMLSFQNRLNVIENFPLILYFIIICIGRGSIYFRSTLHGLSINLLHSGKIKFKYSCNNT